MNLLIKDRRTALHRHTSLFKCHCGVSGLPLENIYEKKRTINQ